jgi:hypothetical protein
MPLEEAIDLVVNDLAQTGTQKEPRCRRMDWLIRSSATSDP